MCGVCEQEIAKSLWTCKSQSQSKVVYKIEQLQPTCVNESCRMKCPYMDCVSLCRHMYHCECADYANGHICKHLHGVHMWLLSNNISSDLDGTYVYFPACIP